VALSSRTIDRDRGRSVQAHVKLLGLTEQVKHALDLTGFSVLFEIHTDLPQAIDSFRQVVMEARMP
jgi:anti-anti-sigma regulatory factor